MMIYARKHYKALLALLLVWLVAVLLLYSSIRLAREGFPTLGNNIRFTSPKRHDSLHLQQKTQEASVLMPTVHLLAAHSTNLSKAGLEEIATQTKASQKTTSQISVSEKGHTDRALLHKIATDKGHLPTSDEEKSMADQSSETILPITAEKAVAKTPSKGTNSETSTSHTTPADIVPKVTYSGTAASNIPGTQLAPIQPSKTFATATTSAQNIGNPISPTPERPTQARLHRQECQCNKSEYHFLTLKEYKSKFAAPNSTQMEFFNTKYIKDSYTVVILSYKRDNAIPILLEHFCTAPHVHKILFVWQNIGQPVPEHFFSISCKVPFKFIYPETNVLSNRFKLYEEIETEAIFTIDDDSYMKHEMLNAGFEAWKSYRHLMVGFISRTHSVVKDSYHYHDTYQCYSIVLTGIVFLHRKYLEMYSNSSSDKLRKFVKEMMNGEDIVMNGIVSNYLSEAGIDLTPSCHGILIEGGRVEFNIPGAGYAGLYRRRDHVKERDKSVEMIADFFGGLPLTCCHYQISKPLS